MGKSCSARKISKNFKKYKNELQLRVLLLKLAGCLALALDLIESGLYTMIYNSMKEFVYHSPILPSKISLLENILICAVSMWWKGWSRLASMDNSFSIVLLHYSLKGLLFAANRTASQFVQSVGIAGSDAQEVFQNTGHFTILGNPDATRS